MPLGGGARGDGVREVAGRGARERLEAELLRLRGGDGDDAVLERVRRVREVELQAAARRRRVALASRGAGTSGVKPGPLAASAGGAAGSSVGVAPERARPGLDPLAA